jgi:hypothetical protein
MASADELRIKVDEAGAAREEISDGLQRICTMQEWRDVSAEAG